MRLERALCLGLTTPMALEALAWERGCRYYPRRDAVVDRTPPEFSNEEPAISLMHPSLPWDARRLRIAAAVAGSHDNDPRRLARLAILEQAAIPLRYSAFAGAAQEPATSFRPEMLKSLPPTTRGVMPHPSRFAALTGKTPPGTLPADFNHWIRPILVEK